MVKHNMVSASILDVLDAKINNYFHRKHHLRCLTALPKFINSVIRYFHKKMNLILGFASCWPCFFLNRVLKKQFLKVLPSFFFRTTKVININIIS